MTRQIQISSQPEKTRNLIARIRETKGVLGIRVYYDVGIKPPGDVITVELTSRSMIDVIRVLDRHGITNNPQSSVLISQPTGLICPSSAAEITNDASEILWEEMELTLNKEGGMTLGLLSVMAISGFITVLGIMSGALHLVIGAMVIAPGFEPIIRISLGIVARSAAWQRGIHNVLAGYGALLAGAATASVFLQVCAPFMPEGNAYTQADKLVAYWSNLTLPSLMISAAASLGGTLLVASNRSVLTAGVMIALALIPSASLFGAEMVDGNWQTAMGALFRWLVDVLLVVASSCLVFTWKRFRLHRRRMAL